MRSRFKLNFRLAAAFGDLLLVVWTGVRCHVVDELVPAIHGLVL